ncbi:MAG TPA: alginate lyase family protein [Planctomycetaceae bacterium]|nr:alginate lyase family protein [Planctomycetaceae bacterium]
MSLKELPRLARTVAHLRPSQILWRGRYALRRREVLQSLGESASLPARAFQGNPLARLREQDFPLCSHAGPLADEQAVVDRLSRGLFRHLDEERPLGRPPDWLLGPRDCGRLWTVTLHYHHWACQLAAIAAAGGACSVQAGELFREYLDDWIERCDLSHPGARHLAWNSYAIGTRLDQWGRSALRLGPAWWSANPEFAQRFLSSLWQQANHLAGNIEWDLRGNHLVRDAVGLAWAGRFFDGPDAPRWLEQASQLAFDQSNEQVLADGGHFERSPMYHLRVMHDFDTLSRLITDRSVQDRLKSVVGRMQEFAAWMQHPDGGIALFNDAALDEELSLDGIPDRAATDPRGGRHFADTGLAVWRGAKWTVFFDVGLIGPDYQPGHGHADNLTLECSYAGERLFVDPGTHSYDRDERRAYDRSTAAHNTVCVDETDSSEVWHIFRVGRRARPLDVQVIADETRFDASAAHDGYRHLGGVTHRRHVLLTDDETLTITDRVEGSSSHKLEGGWLLAPRWTAMPAKTGWQLEREGTSVRLQLKGPTDLQLSVETRPWHPRFGVEFPTTRLVWRRQGPLPFELTTTVAPSS